GLSRIIVNRIITDFGLAGTVVQFDGDRAAAIRFQGTTLSDARIRDWVRSGDVFALVQHTSPGRAVAVPHCYFVVSGLVENGQVNGKIESRFTKPLAGWEIGRFYAVKLGTTRAPVRLRLVGPNDATPAEVTVQLSATGFASGDAERERGPARGGRFASMES